MSKLSIVTDPGGKFSSERPSEKGVCVGHYAHLCCEMKRRRHDEREGGAGTWEPDRERRFIWKCKSPRNPQAASLLPGDLHMTITPHTAHWPGVTQSMRSNTVVQGRTLCCPELPPMQSPLASMPNLQRQPRTTNPELKTVLFRTTPRTQYINRSRIPRTSESIT